MINKQKNNILNTTEQEKKEIEKLFLDAETINPKELLTFITNLLYNTTLTDMETCYKAFRTDFIKGIEIKSDRFDFEPEITAKVLKRHPRLYEMPISYYGREYSEGKKITWKDGIHAVIALIKYRFTD